VLEVDWWWCCLEHAQSQSHVRQPDAQELGDARCRWHARDAKSELPIQPTGSSIHFHRYFLPSLDFPILPHFLVVHDFAYNSPYIPTFPMLD
jgi:hypothetical protein